MLLSMLESRASLFEQNLPPISRIAVANQTYEHCACGKQALVELP